MVQLKRKGKDNSEGDCLRHNRGLLLNTDGLPYPERKDCKMADFFRDDRIPKAGPKWWIERVKADTEALFTVFSRSVFGVWTHWGLYGSSPCLAERSKCAGCANKLPRRWKGYVHAYDHHNKRQCFLELTPIVAESVQKQLGDGQVWRGFRLRLKRGKGEKARVKVEVLGILSTGPELVDEKCPGETLEKLWSLKEYDHNSDDQVF